MVPQDDVTIAQRTSQPRLSGSKDRHHGHAKQRGQVHRAGIVGKEQSTFAQFINQLIQRSTSDPIDAMIADRSRNLIARWRVIFRSKQNPLHRGLSAYFCRNLGESLGKPLFGRSIFRSRAKSDFRSLMLDV